MTSSLGLSGVKGGPLLELEVEELPPEPELEELLELEDELPLELEEELLGLDELLLGVPLELLDDGLLLLELELDELLDAEALEEPPLELEELLEEVDELEELEELEPEELDELPLEVDDDELMLESELEELLLEFDAPDELELGINRSLGDGRKTKCPAFLDREERR